MPQLNNAQARIIDPVLSAVAQGFKQSNFVGFDLFPRVPVAQRAGRITAFSKEDFMLYNTGRAPGQNTKRVQFGYAAGSYVLESHSLEGTVPIETLQEAAAVPGIDLAKKAIFNMQNVIATRLEKAQADVARTLASYNVANRITLSGTGQWSDFGTVSDPIAVVEAGKEAVRRRIGRLPNTAVMGAAVFAALRQHPKVIDRMKFTGRDVPTVEILASLFGLKNVLVGDAVWSDDAGVFNDM